MTGELCSLAATHVLLGSPSAQRYTGMLLRELEHPPYRPAARRLFWVHTLPNWQDSMIEVLEAGGRCELVGSDLACDWLGKPDPEMPYESMARRVTECICNGPATRRIGIIMDLARQANADGIVIFCHWGCKQTMGLAQIAKDILEKEGFPTLILDGDGCDSRNACDGQMVTRLNAFLEQLEG